MKKLLVLLLFLLLTLVSYLQCFTDFSTILKVNNTESLILKNTNFKNPPNFRNDEEIKELLVLFSDSNNVKKELGNEFYTESSSRHLNTVTGCHSTYWYEMYYENIGVTIKNTISKDSTNNELSTIILDENCSWIIKGIQCNKSTFNQLDQEGGAWIEFVDDEPQKYRFGKVTPYAIFMTETLTESFIDSLEFDYEDTALMNDHFGDYKVKKISLSKHRWSDK